MKYDVDESSRKLQLSAENAQMDLPDDYHFCAVIYEMVKQHFHAREWFTVKRESRIEETSFVFKKWKSEMAKPLKVADQPKRSLKVSISVKNPEFSIDENKLKKNFVDKSESVEILEQKNFFRVKQKTFEKFWQRVHEFNLNDKFMHVKGKNLLL